jgi:hypothetical protein
MKIEKKRKNYIIGLIKKTQVAKHQSYGNQTCRQLDCKAEWHCLGHTAAPHCRPQMPQEICLLCINHYQ